MLVWRWASTSRSSGFHSSSGRGVPRAYHAAGLEASGIEIARSPIRYRAALAEVARVCRRTFAVTVPDMMCLPIGRGRGYVPWHLLEATHVNFFNHRSLAKVLARHFRSIQFFQLARDELEGQFMPGSLAAIAMK